MTARDLPSELRHTIAEWPGFDIWGFLLFSHGWTWAWWSVNVLAGYDAFGSGLPFTVLGGAGPLFGGMIMTYVVYGRSGLSNLRVRIFDPGRIPAKWAVVVLGFFPAVVVVTGLVTGIVTGTRFPLETDLGELIASPTVLLTTVLVILVVGPIPEEVGWRGYLLDRVQVRWSALTSGLAVGFVWASWHAPLFVMPGYFANFDFEPDPVWFVASIVLGSVIYTWIYNNTGRSVLAVIGFHFVENFVGQVTSLPPVADPVGVTIRVGIVVVLVVLFGSRTLRRDERLPTPPSPRRCNDR